MPRAMTDLPPAPAEAPLPPGPAPAASTSGNPGLAIGLKAYNEDVAVGTIDPAVNSASDWIFWAEYVTRTDLGYAGSAFR